MEFSICERNIYINENKNILLDKDKLVVSWNDLYPVLNDCRLGRYKLKQNWIELLDRDKLVVLENDPTPVLNDCSLGRYKQQNQIIKYFQ